MEEVLKTNISEVYDNFQSKISDYSLIAENITDEDIEEEFFGYFDSARTKFLKCKNDLFTISNDGDFNMKLHPYEIEIITTLMLAEYMKPQIYASEILKQSLSDKDFKIYSQASQLRELSLLYRNTKKEADKMMTKYTYFGLEDKR